MDEAINQLAFKLSKSHQEATKKLKKVFWKGTEDWDELLSKRSKISGELILSEFSKNAIKKSKINKPVEIYQGTIKSFFEEFKNLRRKKIYLIVDENTFQHINYLEDNFLVSSTHLKLESGEKNKTFNSVLKIWDFLNRNNVKSSDLLFILGGGMLTDLAGFAASTYKRGIEFVYFPTTLLAMADAAIGGKTGFNYQFLKNNIGTFTLPKAIFLDTTFLTTLSKIELDSGIAEVYKHSIIGDADLWNYLKEIPKS